MPGAGGVSILFGTAAGLTATAPDDQWFDMLTAGVKGEPRANDNFATRWRPAISTTAAT